MLFYVHYLKLPQLLTGPDSKLNLLAVDRGKTSLWGLISFPMTTSKTTSKTF